MGTEDKQANNCYNGAVVCFQKYNIATIPAGAACLGYFNHVDVKQIRDFREYMQVTSEHGADEACSRKQLLLRRIKGLRDREEVILKNSADVGNGLAFASKDETDLR